MIPWLDNRTEDHAPDWLLVKLGMIVGDIVGHLSQNRFFFLRLALRSFLKQ